jgi:hypothetical protein
MVRGPGIPPSMTGEMAYRSGIPKSFLICGPRLNCRELVVLEQDRQNDAMPAKAKRGRSPMSTSHKAALAEGREQGRSVRRYLEALEAHKPKRGRKRTLESMQKRLKYIEEALPNTDPLSRLQLVQERMNLERDLAAADAAVDLAELEEDFVKAAGPYGRRKGISYAAWREAGVDPSVLRRAGVSRGGS